MSEIRSQRHKDIGSAYAEATGRLRRKHDKDFRLILEEVYLERGITARKLVRGARKIEADLIKAHALIAKYETKKGE